MASNGMSTAGMTLNYAVEATLNERPERGYTKIPEVKTMPSFNPSPSTIEVTPLEEEEFVLYVKGLKDLGGALEFGANLTNQLIDVWEGTGQTTPDGVMDKFEALTGGKSIWWAIIHPTLEKAIYFRGDPSHIGLNETSVNAALETTLYITPNSAPTMAAKPTT